MLDVGCGNGRLSRLLAEDFPRVLGVEVSSAAVDLARRESDGLDRVDFRQADITAARTGGTDGDSTIPGYHAVLRPSPR